MDDWHKGNGVGDELDHCVAKPPSPRRHSVSSACLLLIVSASQAGTPFPTAFDRIDAALEGELFELRAQRDAIEAVASPSTRSEQMLAFMQNLRAIMVRVHEELLPEIRPALQHHLHGKEALERKAERETAADIEADTHIERMARALALIQELAELQQWHIDMMQREAPQ